MAKSKEGQPLGTKRKAVTDRYTGRITTYYRNAGYEAHLNALLTQMCIEPSESNRRALSLYHALNYAKITQDDVLACFPQHGINPYLSAIERIWTLSEQVAAIREREYASVEKYKKPESVKLKEEQAELEDTIARYQAGAINPDTDQPYDALDIAGELTDIVYYASKVYRENHDTSAWLHTVNEACQRVNVALALDTITPRVTLLLADAKYTCRVEHPTLKQQNRRAAIALERDALSEVLELLH